MDALQSVPDAGYWLYRLHVALLFLLLSLYYVYPSLRIFILILYIPIFLLHITAKHCPVTRLERKLHGEDITILDLPLQLLGIPTTKGNRNRFQVIASTGVLFLFVWGAA
jgi:hypothetical protein